MRFYFSILAIVFFSALSAQTSYIGYIDKAPIELVTYIYSDGAARATYAYSKYNEPIVINGRQNKNVLDLFEKDVKGQLIATLHFEQFDPKSSQLNGEWQNAKNNQHLPIVLNKQFDIDYGDSVEWKDREIIQPVSLKDKYFKLVISKNKADFYAMVSGVKILDKKTNGLVRFIPLECALLGIENISKGDYNFDGYEDFSVFEMHHAGPNTTSLYFLYDPKRKDYFDSKFEGVSLEFDQKKKTIFEYNQCCSGTIHTTSIYRVVNNKMVLKETHCYVWDKKKQKLVEREMKDCQ